MWLSGLTDEFDRRGLASLRCRTVDIPLWNFRYCREAIATTCGKHHTFLMRRHGFAGASGSRWYREKHRSNSRRKHEQRFY